MIATTLICHSLRIYITNLSFECLVLLAHTIPGKLTNTKSTTLAGTKLPYKKRTVIIRNGS